MKKILVIEDDKSIAELERDYIVAEGFDCTIEGNGSNGLTLALYEKWDLIILDLMLPDIDGFSICRTIRDKVDIPIIMVSARKGDIDKIRGLGLGADDYLTKPFSMGELIARIKSHLARYERLKGSSQKREPISFRGLDIDPIKFKVKKNMNDIILRAKEFEILYLLLSNPDRVFSKEELFDRLWTDSYGDISTVTVHMRKLREKIESNPSEPEYIETIWGVGYRLKV